MPWTTVLPVRKFCPFSSESFAIWRLSCSNTATRRTKTSPSCCWPTNYPTGATRRAWAWPCRHLIGPSSPTPAVRYCSPRCGWADSERGNMLTSWWCALVKIIIITVTSGRAIRLLLARRSYRLPVLGFVAFRWSPASSSFRWRFSSSTAVAKNFRGCRRRSTTTSRTQRIRATVTQMNYLRQTAARVRSTIRNRRRRY